MGMVDVAVAHRRLGGGLNQAGGGTQPQAHLILLTLTDKIQRTTILSNASRLKACGGNFSRIYIKKDVHPSVRKEWRRLRDVEAAEKAKPENVGCVIRLDARELKVYKDNTVIDTWNAQFFLDGPHCISNIKIMSWNMNSVCTKLEKSNVHRMLCEYDIISIN